MQSQKDRLTTDWLTLVRSGQSLIAIEAAEVDLDHVLSALLCVAFIDLKSSYACCIVNGCKLIPFDPFAVFPFEYKELNIHLDMMSWYLFLVSFGVHLASSDITRKTANAMTF